MTPSELKNLLRKKGKSKFSVTVCGTKIEIEPTTWAIDGEWLVVVHDDSEVRIRIDHISIIETEALW